MSSFTRAPLQRYIGKLRIQPVVKLFENPFVPSSPPTRPVPALLLVRKSARLPMLPLAMEGRVMRFWRNAMDPVSVVPSTIDAPEPMLMPFSI